VGPIKPGGDRLYAIREIDRSRLWVAYYNKSTKSFTIRSLNGGKFRNVFFNYPFLVVFDDDGDWGYKSYQVTRNGTNISWSPIKFIKNTYDGQNKTSEEMDVFRFSNVKSLHWNYNPIIYDNENGVVLRFVPAHNAMRHLSSNAMIDGTGGVASTIPEQMIVDQASQAIRKAPEIITDNVILAMNQSDMWEQNTDIEEFNEQQEYAVGFDGKMQLVNTIDADQNTLNAYYIDCSKDFDLPVYVGGLTSDDEDEPDFNFNCNTWGVFRRIPANFNVNKFARKFDKNDTWDDAKDYPAIKLGISQDEAFIDYTRSQHDFVVITYEGKMTILRDVMNNESSCSDELGEPEYIASYFIYDMNKDGYDDLEYYLTSSTDKRKIYYGGTNPGFLTPPNFNPPTALDNSSPLVSSTRDVKHCAATYVTRNGTHVLVEANTQTEGQFYLWASNRSSETLITGGGDVVMIGEHQARYLHGKSYVIYFGNVNSDNKSVSITNVYLPDENELESAYDYFSQGEPYNIDFHNVIAVGDFNGNGFSDIATTSGVYMDYTVPFLNMSFEVNVQKKFALDSNYTKTIVTGVKLLDNNADIDYVYADSFANDDTQLGFGKTMRRTTGADKTTPVVAKNILAKDKGLTGQALAAISGFPGEEDMVPFVRYANELLITTRFDEDRERYVMPGKKMINIYDKLTNKTISSWPKDVCYWYPKETKQLESDGNDLLMTRKENIINSTNGEISSVDESPYITSASNPSNQAYHLITDNIYAYTGVSGMKATGTNQISQIGASSTTAKWLDGKDTLIAHSVASYTRDWNSDGTNDIGYLQNATSNDVSYFNNNLGNSGNVYSVTNQVVYDENGNPSQTTDGMTNSSLTSDKKVGFTRTEYDHMKRPVYSIKFDERTKHAEKDYWGENFDGATTPFNSLQSWSFKAGSASYSTTQHEFKELTPSNYALQTSQFPVRINVSYCVEFDAFASGDDFNLEVYRESAPSAAKRYQVVVHAESTVTHFKYVFQPVNNVTSDRLIILKYGNGKLVLDNVLFYPFGSSIALTSYNAINQPEVTIQGGGARTHNLYLSDGVAIGTANSERAITSWKDYYLMSGAAPGVFNDPNMQQNVTFVNGNYLPYWSFEQDECLSNANPEAWKSVGSTCLIGTGAAIYGKKILSKTFSNSSPTDEIYMQFNEDHAVYRNIRGAAQLTLTFWALSLTGQQITLHVGFGSLTTDVVVSGFAWKRFSLVMPNVQPVSGAYRLSITGSSSPSQIIYFDGFILEKGLNSNEPVVVTKMFDAFGNVIQNQSMDLDYSQADLTNGKLVVDRIEFDHLNRVLRQSLPLEYSLSPSDWTVNVLRGFDKALTDPSSIFWRGIANAYPYHEYEYYNVPGNHLKKVKRPGELHSQDIEYTYGIETMPNTPVGNLQISTPVIVTTQNYKAKDGGSDVFERSYADPLGRIVKQEKEYTEEGKKKVDSTRYIYNYQGKVEKIIRPKDASVPVAGKYETFEYNSAGQLMKKGGSNYKGKAYTYCYDVAGNLCIMQDPNGSEGRYFYWYAYDGLNRLVSVKKVTDVPIVVLYESTNKYLLNRNRIIQTVSNTEQFPWVRNPLAIQLLGNKYDDLVGENGFKDSLEYWDDNVRRHKQGSIYFENQYGRLASSFVNNDFGQSLVENSYSYSRNGNVSLYTQKVVGESYTNFTNYYHYASGMLSGYGYDMGIPAHWASSMAYAITYDGRGNIDSVNSTPSSFKYAYNEYNKVKQFTDCRGYGPWLMQNTYSLRGLLEKTEWRHKKQDQNEVALFTEELDYSGRRDDNITQSEIDYAYLLTGAISHYTRKNEYTYDDVGRLTETNMYDNGASLTETRTYSYYADGNILGKTDQSGSYSYLYEPASDKLAEVKKEGNTYKQYVYDENGNMVQDNEKRIRLKYDWRNLPVEAKSYDATQFNEYLATSKGIAKKAVAFIYDAAGNRVAKMEFKYK